MLEKIVAGSSARRTRFHDQKAQRVTLDRALRNGTRAFATNVLRSTLGRRPVRPWISYDATALLDAYLDKRCRVLEFGSGMSTVWYAERAGHVTSIENDRPWYDDVARLFRRSGIANVDYVFAATPDAYVDVPDPDAGFDLVMVDGSYRDRCAEAALPLLRPGGIFYLDNSDRAADAGTAEHRAAEIALAYARRTGASVTYFTDFAPTQFFAGEGMMVRRPPA